MKNRQIYFTEVHKAELLGQDMREIGPGELRVKMLYTVISGGTERACLMGMQNTAFRRLYEC